MCPRQGGQGRGLVGQDRRHEGGGRRREEDQDAAGPGARQDGVLHPQRGEGGLQGTVPDDLSLPSFNQLCVFIS